MKLGVEKKEERWKLYVLGALVAGIGWLMYSNLAPDSGPSTSSAPIARNTPSAPISIPGAAPAATSEPIRRRANGRVAGDFRPKLRPARPEERPDLTKIDPTIHLAQLTKVQTIEMEGGVRNIFQFGVPIQMGVVSPIPKVKPITPGAQSPKPAAPVNPGPPPVPPAPQAPPIPFKYYGYSSVKGEPRKRAFFLDGEDVIVAWEGDTIKNRYKVVHVSFGSVEMEDTQFKSNNKQTLKLVEDVAG